MRLFQTILTVTCSIILLSSQALGSDRTPQTFSLETYLGEEIIFIDLFIPRGDRGGEIRVYRNISSTDGGQDYTKHFIPRRRGLSTIVIPLPAGDARAYYVEVWRRAGIRPTLDRTIDPVFVLNDWHDIPIGHPYGDDMVFDDDNPFDDAIDPVNDFGDGSNDEPADDPQGRPGLGGHGDPNDFSDGNTVDPAEPQGRPVLGGHGDPNDFSDGSDGASAKPKPQRPIRYRPGSLTDFDEGGVAHATGGSPRQSPFSGANDADATDTGDGNIPDRTETDCNDNNIPDRMEIDAFDVLDLNTNNILDECENLGDIDGDGRITVGDLIALMTRFGSCEGCTADLDSNGTVDVRDLLIVLQRWDTSVEP